MKKMIFGCSLMLLGEIGGIGWTIAYALMSGFKGLASIIDIFPVIGRGDIDGYIILLFHIISFVGVFFAGKSMSEELVK